MNRREYLTNAHNLFVDFHTIANIVSEAWLQRDAKQNTAKSHFLIIDN